MASLGLDEKTKIRDLYLELTDLLIYQDSSEKAQQRIHDIYNNSNVAAGDFNYEMTLTCDPAVGDRYEGLMLVITDWKDDLKEVIWQIRNIMGDAIDQIAFPQDSDIEKNQEYTTNVIIECAMALEANGIAFGGLDFDMDTSFHYLTKIENFEKVRALFDELGIFTFGRYSKN